MAESSTRLLRKLIPSLVAIRNSPDNLSIGGVGWEDVSPPGTFGIAVWRGYFDVSGLTNDGNTLFNLGGQFQEPDLPTLESDIVAPSSPKLTIWDIISTEKIRDEAFDGGTSPWCPPGLTAGINDASMSYDLEQIWYGNCKTYTRDTAMPFGVVQIRSTHWGCGRATAADKIYITRVVIFDPQVYIGEMGFIGAAAAVVLPIAIDKEPDLVRLERMRRSYVLAENR
jgi:hypothetical protein